MESLCGEYIFPHYGTYKKTVNLSTLAGLVKIWSFPINHPSDVIFVCRCTFSVFLHVIGNISSHQRDYRSCSAFVSAAIPYFIRFLCLHLVDQSSAKLPFITVDLLVINVV